MKKVNSQRIGYVHFPKQKKKKEIKNVELKGSVIQSNKYKKKNL